MENPLIYNKLQGELVWNHRLNADGNIVCFKDRLTAVIGVKDLIVEQADGITLICPKDPCAGDQADGGGAFVEKGGFDELL